MAATITKEDVVKFIESMTVLELSKWLKSSKRNSSFRRRRDASHGRWSIRG
jgi:hypothetical protein